MEVATTFDLEEFISSVQKEVSDRETLASTLQQVLGQELWDALQSHTIHDGQKAKCHMTYRHRILLIEEVDGQYEIHIGGVSKEFDETAIASRDLKTRLGLALGRIRDEANKQ